MSEGPLVLFESGEFPTFQMAARAAAAARLQRTQHKILRLEEGIRDALASDANTSANSKDCDFGLELHGEVEGPGLGPGR